MKNNSSTSINHRRSFPMHPQTCHWISTFVFIISLYFLLLRLLLLLLVLKLMLVVVLVVVLVCLFFFILIHVARFINNFHICSHESLFFLFVFYYFSLFVPLLFHSSKMTNQLLKMEYFIRKRRRNI